MELEAHDNLDMDIDERPRVIEYADGKIDPQTGEQIKNSLMEAADRDVKEDEDEPELTPLEKEQKLRWAVTRQPLLREIMYKIMDLCRTETELHDLEDAVDGFPEYAIIRQSALSIADILVKNHGLEVIERDGEGNVVLPEQKEGLTEDEVDDLVATINYRTTSFGEDYVRANRPAVRLEQMLNLNPERRETYAEVLQFLDEEPRLPADTSSRLSWMADPSPCSPACFLISWNMRVPLYGEMVGRSPLPERRSCLKSVPNSP